jgi:cation transport ATPase
MTLIAIFGLEDPEVLEARTMVENIQAGEVRTHLISKDNLESTTNFAKKVSII